MTIAIVLCSGGIDSVTALYLAKKKYERIIILFFDYGQPQLQGERKAVRHHVKMLNVEFKEIRIILDLYSRTGISKEISLKDLKDTKIECEKYYVPARNLLFLAYAISFAETLKGKLDIVIGFKNEGEEHYPDTSASFVREMNNISRIATKNKPRIIAPLIKKDKEDIILLAKKLGVNLENTFSCYISREVHCGLCLACRLRQEGFYWANVKDKTKYKKLPKDYRSA